jgi:DNA-binding NtrC family response regulator
VKGILTHLRQRFASTALPVEPVLSPKSSCNNVLVVDDDNAVCRIVQRMLSDQHYQVQTSQCVADAILAIEQKSFDAYVMDDKLPDGSGLDVAERIRAKRSEAPIILMSGYDASSVASKAEKFRISDFLQKPFSRETICNVVKKAIESPKATLASPPADGTGHPGIVISPVSNCFLKGRHLSDSNQAEKGPLVQQK